MSKTVIIYTTQTCGYCKATKEFFTQNGITYTEHDVGLNSEKAREMIAKSGQMGVPVSVIGVGADEQLIVGFDKHRLAEALGVAAS